MGSSLVREHPLSAYFGLSFALSWGGVLLAFGLGPISPEALEERGAFLYLALLAGPSVAGLSMTGLVSGRAGFRELRDRLLRWRVAPSNYAFALLAAPLSLGAVLLGLSQIPDFMPDLFTSEGLGTRLLTGIAAGLAVATCEEIGWTGFAIPRLRERHGVLASGALLGLLWGAWHFPPFWESDSFARPLALAVLLARLFSWLPAFRVLMVWLHERSESLLLVILMHASLVATQLVLVASVEFDELAGLTYILVWAALLWIVAVVVTGRGRERGPA